MVIEYEIGRLSSIYQQIEDLVKILDQSCAILAQR